MTNFVNNNLWPKMIDYEYYPPNYSQSKDPFYIEYSRWNPDYRPSGGTSTNYNFYKGWNWKLCKRHFFDNVPDDCLSSKEGHPYYLYEGQLNEDPCAVLLNTRQYLQFMVDAMNEKTKTSNP